MRENLYKQRSAVSRIIAGIIAINIIVAAIAMNGNFIVQGFYPGLPNALADVNVDGIVDIADIYSVALAFGTVPGIYGYKHELDLNSDNIIDISDIYTTALAFGKILDYTQVTLKVALMVGGDESDLGFSMKAIEGAEAIATKYPWWTVSISKMVQYWNQRNVAAAYGDAGYDIVFCVGGQFMSMLYGWDGSHMPDDYPNTLWVMVPGAGYSDRANLVVLGQAFQTVGHFLAGVLAAKMTHTGAVAWIVGDYYDPSYTCMECNAFMAGVHSINSSVVVYSRELDTENPWGDPTLGKTVAKSLIDTYDVDIIVQVADFSGLGIIQACEEAGSPYPMVIGTCGDQWLLAPDNTLTSVLMDTPEFMEMIIRCVLRGKFLGYQSLDVDLSGLAPFHNLDPLVPQSVRDLLADRAAGIRTHAIIVPQDSSLPPEHSP